MNLTPRDLDATFSDMIVAMGLASGDKTIVRRWPLRPGFQSIKSVAVLEDASKLDEYRAITYNRLPSPDYEAFAPVLFYFHNVRFSTQDGAPITVRVEAHTTVQVKTDVLQSNLATKHGENELADQIKMLRASASKANQGPGNGKKGNIL